MEGDPPGRGCPAAVLRIWTNPDAEDAPQEICGEKSATENWPTTSVGPSGTIRISFTTTDKTIGAQVRFTSFRVAVRRLYISGLSK